MAALDQEQAERVDGGGFADAGRAGDADAHRLAGIAQQRLHQLARGGLMVGAPALDQRDRPRQCCALAGTEVLGQRLDVEGNPVRTHALLYYGRASQARGHDINGAWSRPARPIRLSAAAIARPAPAI